MQNWPKKNLPGKFYLSRSTHQKLPSQVVHCPSASRHRKVPWQVWHASKAAHSMEAFLRHEFLKKVITARVHKALQELNLWAASGHNHRICQTRKVSLLSKALLRWPYLHDKIIKQAYYCNTLTRGRHKWSKWQRLVLCKVFLSIQREKSEDKKYKNKKNPDWILCTAWPRRIRCNATIISLCQLRIRWLYIPHCGPHLGVAQSNSFCWRQLWCQSMLVWNNHSKKQSEPKSRIWWQAGNKNNWSNFLLVLLKYADRFPQVQFSAGYSNVVCKGRG